MKSNCCFIDTSAFIALNNAHDQHYRDALEIAYRLNGKRFVISDAVITETYSLLRYRVGFHSAYRFLSLVLDNQEYDIVDVLPSHRQFALRLLEKYNDHKISYCDALSVAIMKENMINTVFTFDHHFELLGVERIY